MIWFMLMLGLVMTLAPWYFGYSDSTPALWTSVILGLILAFVSGYKATTRDRATWEYGVIALVGGLALIAPFALRFTALTTATWTISLIGLVALVTAVYELFVIPRRTRTR